MKKRTTVVFIIVVIIILIALLDEIGVLPLATNNREVVQTSQMVPNLALQTIDGANFSLTDLQGKVILLNIWASWCDSCLADFPAKLNLLRELDDKIVLVAISNDYERKEIDAFLDKQPGIKQLINKRQVYIVWDQQGKISRKQLGVVRLPETFIINPEQKMVKKVIGSTDWTNPEMIGYLKSL